MGLCCRKKITVENRTSEVKKGNIKIEFDNQFSVPIVIADFDGFLTAHCRVWREMKDEESPEYLKKFTSVQSLDTVN